MIISLNAGIIHDNIDPFEFVFFPFQLVLIELLYYYLHIRF